MARDLNVYPYYDDSLSNEERNFTGQYDKGYREVAFVPGRELQAREVTQLQTFKRKQMEDNWNTIYKNGSLVSDIELSIKDETDGSTTANCTVGQYYFEGRVLKVTEQSIPITGSGTENIGFFVEETIITENDDEALTDPASGTTNYSLPGAHRVKVDVYLRKVIAVGATPSNDYELPEDTNGLKIIWELEDKIIQNYVRRPDYSILAESLARRTYDESGHYLVEGMKVTVEEANTPEGEDPYTYDNPNIDIIVGSGICYVKGFDQTFIVPKKKQVSRSLDTKTLELETHTYNTGTSDYFLNYPYVITDDDTTYPFVVNANVSVTHSQTRGSGDYDDIASGGTTYERIVSITSIPGYTQGVDYELSSDKVHWLGGGSRPAGGTSYSITFVYLKEMVRDIDYTLEEDTDQSYLYYISFTGTGDLPVDASLFLVDYYVYQARTDLVSIDKRGEIIVKTGISTDYDEIVIPPFDEETLPLGWIKFMPGTYDRDQVVINEYKYKRTTMFELHYLRERVDDLEENQATLALETEAKEGEPATTLKGILVDNFSSIYKANTTHPEYYASINLIDEELTMVSYERPEDLDRDNDVRSNISIWKDNLDNDVLLTLEKTSELEFFNQPLKSSTMNLNPYGTVKKSPFAEINPEKDLWIDQTIVEKTVVENEIRNTVTNFNMMKWSGQKQSSGSTTSEKMQRVGGEKKEISKNVISEKLVTFARSGRVITLQGRSFEPASEVSCTFGEFGVFLSAVAPYRDELINGSATGRIITAADGSFKATFTTPDGVKSGDINVRVTDQDDNEIELVYQSKGVLKIIENRTTITNVFDKIIDVYKWKKPPQPDPSTPKPAPETPKPKPKCTNGEKKRKICTDVGQPFTYGTFIYTHTCKNGRWVATGQRCNPAVEEPDPVEPPDPEPVPPQRPPDPLIPSDLRKDPLAQSFIFQEDFTLVSFDVFFGTKADEKDKPVYTDEEVYGPDNPYYQFSNYNPNEPVILTIGYVRNGLPDGENIIHMQEIQPEDITTSLYGTVPTNVSLNKPIFIPALQEFYISLGSKSSEYTIFVATLGENDLDSGNIIQRNPYLDGTLFASSNGITWTPLQKIDMTIKLYRGVYATSGTITTEQVTFPKSLTTEKFQFNKFGRFQYLNTFAEISESKVNFYYRTNTKIGASYSWTDWLVFNPTEEIDLESDNIGIQFQMQLSGNGSTTPFIDVENSLTFYRYDIRNTEAGFPANSYLTKLVENIPAYNSVKLIIDEKNVASVTSITREFSIDDGVTWIRFTEDPDESIDAGNNFLRKTFILDFDLMQKLTMTTADKAEDFTIGEGVYNAQGGNGKVIGIDSNNNAIYVLLDSDTSEFENGESISNDSDTVTDTIAGVINYANNPSVWPETFIGRLYLESTTVYNSPKIKNLRWVQKAI